MQLPNDDRILTYKYQCVDLYWSGMVGLRFDHGFEFLDLGLEILVLITSLITDIPTVRLSFHASPGYQSINPQGYETRIVKLL